MGLFSSTKKPKKKLRYKVTVKGVTISRHTTKKNATTKAKSIRGARVVPLSKTTRKSYRKKTRRY